VRRESVQSVESYRHGVTQGKRKEREKRERRESEERERRERVERESDQQGVTQGTNRHTNTEREEDVASRGVGDGGKE
jgi:hypothetical protein